MPVTKRAARPTAAPDDPRDPHVSDNDLTVLFRRVARQVRRPGPVPKPPVAAINPAAPARARDRERPHEIGAHRTPLAMALPPQERIETVALAPGPKERAVRIGVLLAIGSVLGILVEMVAWPSAGSGNVESALATSSMADVTDGADERGGQTPGARPAARADEPHRAHATHHHAHHASGAASTATAARAPDAGSETDDVAAAVKMLTKAKAEETLP